MLNIGDVVRINAAHPKEGLTAGAQGTIVMCFAKPTEGYEVEFLDNEGYTKAVLTLSPQDFDVVWTHG